MASFEYQALNESGKSIKGIVEGDHAKHARSLLRVQGLTIIEIKPVAVATDNRTRSRNTKISSIDLSIMTRQLATLIGSGLTVEEALHAIMQQSKNLKLKGLVSDLRSLVTEGYSLSESVRTYPKSFPEIYVSSVRAGEQSGKLDLVMERLSDYLENRNSVQQKVSVALIYPAFLLVACLAIVTGLVAYVVPKVVTVFENSETSLPMMTKALMAISEFLGDYGLILIVFIALVSLVGQFVLKQPGPRYRFHAFCLKVYGLGTMFQSIDSARMARTLSIMVGSGVPLLTSMKSALGVVQNEVLKKDLEAATDEVAQGITISRALDRNGRFPPLLIQMIASGEKNGQLSFMLEKAASATENETQSRITIMVSLFEPIMILVMGLVVLLIVMAILLPIIDLNQALA